MENKQEEWRPVVGFEDRYSVSNLGRVKSFCRLVVIMKHPTADRKKYLSVGLFRDRKLHTIRVHALVAAAFIGPRPAGYMINHIDADRMNNNASNLEYVTAKQNSLHMKMLGRQARGPGTGTAKLREEDIPIIRRRLAAGESGIAIARDFSVTKNVIYYIKRGEAWTHVI